MTLLMTCRQVSNSNGFNILSSRNNKMSLWRIVNKLLYCLKFDYFHVQKLFEKGFISFGINIFQDPLNEIKTLAKFSVLCALLFHG